MDFSHLQFDCRADDPKRVAEVFHENEVVALEGAVDPGEMEYLGQVCARYFSAVGFVSTAAKNMILHKGASSAKRLSALLYEDEVSVPERICSMIARQPVVPFLQAIFGSPAPGLLQAYIGIRMKDPTRDTTLLPFHQDAYQGGPSDADRLTITAFAPFSDVGGEHPSVDVIAKRSEKIYGIDPGKGKADYQYLHIDEDVFEDELDFLWAPKLKCGGLVLMSGRTLHRSQHSIACTKTRYSMDLRFVDALEPPERFRDNWIFNLATGKYSRADYPGQSLPLFSDGDL